MIIIYYRFDGAWNREDWMQDRPNSRLSMANSICAAISASRSASSGGLSKKQRIRPRVRRSALIRGCLLETWRARGPSRQIIAASKLRIFQAAYRRCG
jgi:hypothetical protein